MDFATKTVPNQSLSLDQYEFIIRHMVQIAP